MVKYLVFFLIAMMLWLVYEWYEHSAVQYNTTHVEFRNLNTNNEFRACVITDLHNNKKKIKDIVKKIKEFAPDAVFLAGDMVDKHKNNNSNAVELICALSECAPVYYSFGNHEETLRNTSLKEWNEYIKSLPASVKILDNCSIVSDKDSSVVISGLSIPEIYYKKGPLYSGEDKLPVMDVPNGSFHIMLAHHPEYVSYYERYNASLIVSGHLHGGLLRLPFIGGVVSPRLRLPFFDSGITDLSDNQKLFVSRGLGSHTIPLRFFNRVEINFLLLEKHA